MEKRGFEPMAYQAARIPVYDRWTPVERRIGSGRVFLVGDAAGQVKVSTVGGIVTGFRGAMGVADAILNRDSRELRALRRELNIHLLIRRTIHRFKQADYSRLVDLMNASTRRSLSHLAPSNPGPGLFTSEMNFAASSQYFAQPVRISATSPSRTSTPHFSRCCG